MKTTLAGDIRTLLAKYADTQPVVFSFDVENLVIDSITLAHYRATDTGVLISEEGKARFMEETPDAQVEKLPEPILEINLVRVDEE